MLGNPYLGQMPQQLQQSPLMQPFAAQQAPQAPAMATGGMLGAQAPKKPGFNDPGGWAERLSAIGDVLGRAGGMGSTGAMQGLMQARQQRRELEAARYAPQHIGQAIVRLNPETNQYETLYAPAETPHVGALQANAEYYRSIGRQDLADHYLTQMAEGPPMAEDTVDPVTGNTVRQYQYRSQATGGGAPAPAGVELPAGYTIRPNGGPGLSAPATFPRSNGRTR